MSYGILSSLIRNLFAKKLGKEIVLSLSTLTIVLLAVSLSTNYASAQPPHYPPVSGQYTNTDYGVNITLPNGWKGIEDKSSYETMVSDAPTDNGVHATGVSLIMLPLSSNFQFQTMMLIPGPIGMAEQPVCNQPATVTTKTVNSVTILEATGECLKTPIGPLKWKTDFALTDKYVITINFIAHSQNYDSYVSAYDTSIGTLQIANAVQPPTVPGETQESATSSGQSSTPTPSSVQSGTTSIPSWIKNNAKWWSQGSLGDDDFVKGMQYLISQGILQVPPTATGSSSSQQIPTWIKNTAGWWASGQIPDDQFVKVIQYLISQGIITIGAPSPASTSQQPIGIQSHHVLVPPVKLQPQTKPGDRDSVVATVGVGTNPLGIAFDPANGYIYVDNGNDNSVSVIDGSTNTLATGFTNPIAVGNAPYGITVDSNSSGEIYVANLGSSTVSVIDGNTNTIATGFTNPINVGSFPNGEISDPVNGDIYVVNDHGNSVSVIEGNPSSTTYNTIIATIPVGTVGTGPNVDAYDPANGYIYVTSNDGVYVIDTSTNAIATGFTNPIQAGSATGIAIDNVNNYIYAANYAAGTVTVINGATNNIATGFTNPVTVGTHPYGVTYDYSDQSIYVANQGSNTVTKISATTSPTVSQTIPVGNQPWGEAYDSTNNCVYVGNYGDGTVSVICPSGTSQGTGTTSSSSGSLTGTIGSGQTYNFATSWSDNVGVNGGGYNPNLAGIAVDSSGNVYVTEPSEGLVLKFDNNGKFITSWTHEQYVNGGNCPGQLAGPWGIAIDSSNNVYVLDASNLMIKKFDSSGNFIKEWGNTYTVNNPPNDCAQGSGGSGNGQFSSYPQAGLAMDQSGNVYAIDSANDRIEKFDSDGNFITTWKIADPVDSNVNLSNAQQDGIAVDQSGNVYLNIHDQSAVVKYSQTTSSCPAGTQLGSYSQNLVTTNICFVKLWEQNKNQSPTGNIAGIAIDSSGNLYLNAGSGGIQKFDPSGNFITSFALSGNQNQAYPSGVAVDSAGNVFVADYTDNEIQKFAPSNP